MNQARKPQDLVFKAPSASALARLGNRSRALAETDKLSQLVEFPDRWAVIRSCPTVDAAAQRATYLRSPKMRGKLPKGRWEIVADELEIFARYLGPEPEPAPGERRPQRGRLATS